MRAGRGSRRSRRAFVVSLPLGVVAGILWSRLRRPEASELVVELQAQTPATIGERLARALGDPTLEIAYRLGDGLYVDAAGRSVELPRDPGRAVTAVTAGGEEVAVLVHDPALLDEPALVESVRATAALVLENERLAAEVRSQLAEVRASRGRIVAAADAERRRIERNLHDGAQQRLVTLSVRSARGLPHRRPPRQTFSRARRTRSSRRSPSYASSHAGSIRPSSGTRAQTPSKRSHDGRRCRSPCAVPCTVASRIRRARRLLRRLRSAHKRRQACVGDRASVLLEQDTDCFALPLRTTASGGARSPPGSGLAGLRDRLEALDGTLEIESEPAHGTTIRAELPCES